jgi:hypothetical protein
MAYALFCNEARLSKAYPTEADAWRVARQSGLVVNVRPDQERGTQPMLHSDYEIRRCAPEQENPVQNQIEADREPLFNS